MRNYGDILTMEQATETVMRTALMLLDGSHEVRSRAESIMEDANKLRHKILELEKYL